MFANRTNWKQTPNRLAVVLEELRSGAGILDLTESNPTRCGFSYPQEKILATLGDARNMSYAPCAKGTLRAREAVCSYSQERNITVDPKRIFLTASTSEAYSFLFRLLANPGEAILFPCPGYPLFEFLSGLNDLTHSFYPLKYTDGWGIDLPALRSAVTTDTKAVVFVNPNNPTGSFVKQEEWTEIHKICQEHRLPVICDEVFWDYRFKESGPVPGWAGHGENLSFCLGGLSKSLGLPQMKVSWIIVNGPEAEVDAAASRLEIIADTYLSVNTPSQNALEEWFHLRPVIQKEIMQRIRQNREFLIKGLPRGCELLHAEGGWYAVLKCPDRYDEEQLALDLLKKDHVLVQPGYFYDFPEEPHIVISLLPPEDVFRKGLEKLAARLSEK